ncbi:DUF1217 domain-containing protein [Salipiger mangrovisoli]|uniref:DUF1217 domain-containing protein n=1 Tax=Salipiger mangrovisoli TaxID=2865933 RepID=A0ABR9WXC9_9RHOB|nr:DUF1217 domain-containing protein [Salipiger mangrovisoli]MBE9635902.1 DUF1217 domain-containing protein [Salipiger mangrovisoli]
MSFQPILIGTGLVAWQFLQSTAESQRASFDKSPSLLRDTSYFAEKIGEVTSAEELVSDRRLLRVALGAYGLQDDIDSKYFVQKLLEEGTTAADALANKLADERYKAFARGFGFDRVGGPRTQLDGFAEEIIGKFRAQQFEVAVGEQDNALRLALSLRRSLPEIASSEVADDTKWFRIMGNQPLRTVFEGALGLPDSLGQLDIDQQLEIFRDKASARFGSDDLAVLAEEETLNRIAQTYLLQEQVKGFSAAGTAQIALTLLQNLPRWDAL